MCPPRTLRVASIDGLARGGLPVTDPDAALARRHRRRRRADRMQKRDKDELSGLQLDGRKAM